MNHCRFSWLVSTMPFLFLAGCDGGSAGFNPPPVNEPPPDQSPAIGVERAFPEVSFNQPLAMLQRPDDDSRWFVVERTGFVREFPNDAGAMLGDVLEFVDISARVDSGPAEAGLLGMAFHPDVASNAEVFLSYTRTAGGLESVVSRFVIDPASGALDAASEEVLLTLPQFAGNHNGGNLAFGPDGFLYAGFGDGGGSGDPQDNGQDTTNLLGTILRIDVDGGPPYAIPADNPFAGNTECSPVAGGMLSCPEIFAWGFRNPWRFSFDRQNGDLWVGDVGQNSWEEVNRVEISENYGWRQREGAHCFDPPSGCSTDNVDPITEYGHNLGDSITGGYVYRGAAIPDLQGFYVFGDFGSGRIWAIPSDSPQGVEPDELLDTTLRIASFAEGNDGEVYLLDIVAGTVHQLVED